MEKFSIDLCETQVLEAPSSLSPSSQVHAATPRFFVVADLGASDWMFGVLILIKYSFLFKREKYLVQAFVFLINIRWYTHFHLLLNCKLFLMMKQVTRGLEMWAASAERSVTSLDQFTNAQRLMTTGIRMYKVFYFIYYYFSMDGHENDAQANF